MSESIQCASCGRVFVANDRLRAVNHRKLHEKIEHDD